MLLQKSTLDISIEGQGGNKRRSYIYIYVVSLLCIMESCDTTVWFCKLFVTKMINIEKAA